MSIFNFLFKKKDKQKKILKNIILLNNDDDLVCLNGINYKKVTFRVVENLDIEKTNVLDYVEEIIEEKKKIIDTQNDLIESLSSKLNSYKVFVKNLHSDIEALKSKKIKNEKDTLKTETISVQQIKIQNYQNEIKRLNEFIFDLKIKSDVSKLNITIDLLKNEKYSLEQKVKQKTKEILLLNNCKDNEVAKKELLELKAIIEKGNLMWNKNELEYIKKEELLESENIKLNQQIERLKIEVIDLKLKKQ